MNNPHCNFVFTNGRYCKRKVNKCDEYCWLHQNHSDLMGEILIISGFFKDVLLKLSEALFVRPYSNSNFNFSYENMRIEILIDNEENENENWIFYEINIFLSNKNVIFMQFSSLRVESGTPIKYFLDNLYVMENDVIPEILDYIITIGRLTKKGGRFSGRGRPKTMYSIVYLKNKQTITNWGFSLENIFKLLYETDKILSIGKKQNYYKKNKPQSKFYKDLFENQKEIIKKYIVLLTNITEQYQNNTKTF